MKDCDLFTKHHLLDAVVHPIAMRGRTPVTGYYQSTLPDTLFLEARLKSENRLVETCTDNYLTLSTRFSLPHFVVHRCRAQSSALT